MADTLTQKLDKNKNKPKQLVRNAAGQLVEASSSNINNISANQGLQAPALSPMDAASRGAGPDSAKMIGTPAQQQGAATMATADQANLADVMRRAQERRQASQQEQGKLDKSQTLQSLLSYGDSVQSLIEKKFNDIAVQQQEQLTLQEGATEGLSPEQTQALSLIQQGNMQGFADWAKATGSTFNAEDVSKYFQDADDMLAQLTAGGVENSVTMDDSFASSLGFKDMQELNDALGFDASGMSVGQFQTQIDAMVAEEYGEVDRLREVASNPNASAAERAAAREELRAKGAIGEITASSDMEALDDAIAEADEVEFNGQKVALDELLSDEYISGLVSSYYNNPESQEELKKNQPEFAEFLDKQQELLAPLTAELEGKAVEFADTKAFNEGLKTSPSGASFSDEMMQILAPGYNPNSTEKLDLSKAPLLDIIHNPNKYGDINGIQLAADLEQLSQLNPKLVQHLNTLSPQKLAQLGVGQEGSTWSKYMERAELHSTLDSIPDTDSDRLLNAFFGAGLDDMQKKYKEAAGLEAVGLAPNPFKSLLDPDGDGIITTEGLKERLLDWASVPDARKLKKDSKWKSHPNAIMEDISNFMKPLENQEDMLKQDVNRTLSGLFGELAQDGYISKEDIAAKSKELALPKNASAVIELFSTTRDSGVIEALEPIVMEHLKGRQESKKQKEDIAIKTAENKQLQGTLEFLKRQAKEGKNYRDAYDTLSPEAKKLFDQHLFTLPGKERNALLKELRNEK